MTPTETEKIVLLQRLIDVKDLTATLVADVVAAVKAIKPSQDHTRRAYVRSVFALIEEALNGLSTFLLEGQTVGGWMLTDKECRAFWDAVAAPTCTRPSGGRPTLLERTKLAFKFCHQYFGDTCRPEFGSEDFSEFQAALRIRDRLMHPKRAVDLVVADDDLRSVDRARDWFRFSAQHAFAAASAHIKTTFKFP